MFSNCNSLGELNKRRKELMLAGTPPMEINSAYNKAKRELMDATPSFRTIPTFGATPREPQYFVPFSILNQRGNPNEIIVLEEGVIL